MSEMHVTAVIQLPDEEFAEAEAKVRLKPAIKAIHDILVGAKVEFSMKHETVHVKPKQVRKPRKARTQPAPATEAPGMPALFPVAEEAA